MAVYPEPLDHDRQEQKAKGDWGGAKTEADYSLCPRDEDLGILRQWGTGEKAHSQTRAVQVWHAGEWSQQLQSYSGAPLEMQYLLEPNLAHYVITKAKEKCWQLKDRTAGWGVTSIIQLVRVESPVLSQGCDNSRAGANPGNGVNCFSQPSHLGLNGFFIFPGRISFWF